MKKVRKSLISIMAVLIISIVSFANIFAASETIEKAISDFNDVATTQIQSFKDKLYTFPISLEENTFSRMNVVIEGHKKSLSDVAIITFDENDTSICRITAVDNITLTAVEKVVKQELSLFTVSLKEENGERYIEVAGETELDSDMYGKLTNSLKKLYSDAKKTLTTKQSECLKALSENNSLSEDDERVNTIFNNAISEIEGKRDETEKTIQELHNKYLETHQKSDTATDESKEGSDLSIPFLKDNRRNLYIVGVIAGVVILILIIIWRKMLPR